MLEAAEGFHGVEHRLELVRELGGVHWYNDSIATAPERSMAAIHAFDEPIVLLLGGRDKDLPWGELAELIQKRVDHVVLFGEAADLIGRAVARAGTQRKVDLRHAQNLKQAVACAAEVAESGDVVLLSPGGTSFDEFRILQKEERHSSDGFWNFREEQVDPSRSLPARFRHAAAGDGRIAVVFGLVMLFSSSWDFSLGAYGDAMHMFNRQLTWLGLGLVIAVALALFDITTGGSMLSQRWPPRSPAHRGSVDERNPLRCKAVVLRRSAQPSELAKLVTILYLSVWLYSKRQHLQDLSLGLIPLGVILGIVGGLIYQQPDLSAAATVLVLGGLLFFLAGGDLKQIGVLLVVAFIAAWLWLPSARRVASASVISLPA